MCVFDKTYLRELPDDQFRQLLGFLRGDVSAGMTISELIDIMIKIKEKRKRKRGVFVETTCGVEHHIETEQEVTAIYVNGKLVYENEAVIPS